MNASAFLFGDDSFQQRDRLDGILAGGGGADEDTAFKRLVLRRWRQIVQALPSHIDPSFEPSLDHRSDDWFSAEMWRRQFIEQRDRALRVLRSKLAEQACGVKAAVFVELEIAPDADRLIGMGIRQAQQAEPKPDRRNFLETVFASGDEACRINLNPASVGQSQRVPGVAAGQLLF